MFQIEVKCALPDATKKVSHEIRCGVLVQGQIECTQEAARKLLELALQADIKLELLTYQLLESEISDSTLTKLVTRLACHGER